MRENVFQRNRWRVIIQTRDKDPGPSFSMLLTLLNLLIMLSGSLDFCINSAPVADLLFQVIDIIKAGLQLQFKRPFLNKLTLF